MAEQLSEEKRFEIVISWCNGEPISEILGVFLGAAVLTKEAQNEEKYS